ncbi:chaperonin 10-like protein [Lanmaoa asiatica]|nr:chaperonin 10-like protein [Lanmaoa asiatica]
MSFSDNTSFVLKKIQHTEFEPRSIPEVGAHDVLVEVKKTGIHYLVHGKIGDYVLSPGSDMVRFTDVDHQFFKVGSSVTHLKPGDRVAIEPGATCKRCDACKEGRYQLCPDVKFAATPPHDGTLGRYYVVPSDLAYPLPSHLTLEDGALIEPLSVAVHAVSKLGDLEANQSIVVFGCGPVGILCMAVAKALGASRIIAVDIVPGRLQFAKSYAATDVYQPPPVAQDESRVAYSKRSAAALRQQLGIAERGPTAIDLVVDASGAEVSIQTGVRIVKTGGTYVQVNSKAYNYPIVISFTVHFPKVGMGPSDITIDMSAVLAKELVMKGSFRYGPGDYPLAIALAAQGKIDLKPLVSHRSVSARILCPVLTILHISFSFENSLLAFQTTLNGKSDDGKGVIKAIISGPGVGINDM